MRDRAPDLARGERVGSRRDEPGRVSAYRTVASSTQLIAVLNIEALGTMLSRSPHPELRQGGVHNWFHTAAGQWWICDHLLRWRAPDGGAPPLVSGLFAACERRTYPLLGPAGQLGANLVERHSHALRESGLRHSHSSRVATPTGRVANHEEVEAISFGLRICCGRLHEEVAVLCGQLPKLEKIRRGRSTHDVTFAESGAQCRA